MCIVIHDVAPATWPECNRILKALATIDDFPVTLLAVPRYHGAARDSRFEDWLRYRASRGDEIALHGFTHGDQGRPRNWIDRVRRKVFTRGKGEFSGLSFEEARDRLRAGLAWLDDLGLPPAGFVAPAWLMSAGTWRAVHELPFDYTCTVSRIHVLSGLRSIRCQSQVYSSSAAWRRRLSVIWNNALARLQRRQPAIRLELHPGDLHRTVRGAWFRLARHQSLSREVCTMQTLISELDA